MRRLLGWRDLLKDNKIDVLGLAAMTKKLSPEISKFVISLDKFEIVRRFKKTKAHEFGEVVLLFDHYTNAECNHVTTMYVELYMGRIKLSSVIRSCSTCDYTAYCNEIQDAMFTYFCSLAENDKRLSNLLKGLSFPEKVVSEKSDEDPLIWDSCMSSMYKGNVYPSTNKNTHVVRNMQHELLKMPIILKIN